MSFNSVPTGLPFRAGTLPDSMLRIYRHANRLVIMPALIFLVQSTLAVITLALHAWMVAADFAAAAREAHAAAESTRRGGAPVINPPVINPPVINH